MVVPFSGALNLLTAPFKSTYEPLIKKGSSGDYSYELWHTSNTSGYYLKILKDAMYPKGEKTRVIGSFSSAKEALDYLDTNYST
jgi:hypothetical protein